VRVITAAGRFTGPRTVQAGDVSIHARYFILATGSRPVTPAIPGLAGTPFLTNETIFDLDTLPDHLLVIGGGPIGLEMAQAFRRLGAAVSVVEAGRLLQRDDPEAAALLRTGRRAEGVSLNEGTAVKAVSAPPGVVTLQLDRDGESRSLTGSHLLVAAGRAPALEGLDLEKAGVAYDRAGVRVDARLRTANRRIFAAGDVTGGYQFTHTAAYEAGVALRNILFRLPARVNWRAVPRVTYTGPEIAQAGWTEAEALERLSPARIRILRWGFAENDRAVTEGQGEGFVKIITDRRGRVLGVTIAGPHAGELLAPWCLMIAGRRRIGGMAGLVLPYPTLSEAAKRAAGSFFTPMLYSGRMRRLVRFLLALSR